MSHGAARQLLYAILSAIEEDIRDHLITHAPPSLNPADVLGPELQTRSTDRLKRDLAETGVPTLAQLIGYSDFGDLPGLARRLREHLPPQTASYLRDVQPRLEELIPIRNRIAHVRPLVGTDVPTTVDTAAALANASMPIWTKLRAVLQQLDEHPHFVLGVKMPTEPRSESSIRNNLPVPDYDETGFIGREQESQLLVQALLGPYPVVSVIGEGGAGKTAVALKAAFELLDITDPPFDAIIWVTCKAAILTVAEIRRIEGAITDSLQMFNALSTELGPSTDDPTAELLQYLRAFRILLILDNLETVLDDRIRQFLERLPLGSKVLVTSRIGLGAFDRPIRLPPMSDNDALNLLRTMAAVRQARMLTNVGNAQLRGYCRRLKHNPGFIKWFVTGVQTGSRPEDLLAHPELFLDYCMSNIYGYLQPDARLLLDALMATPGRLSQAELAFLADLSEPRLQGALAELLTTNMASLISMPLGSTYESVYELSDLARSYLDKHHPMSADTVKRLAARRRELVAATEQMAHDTAARPYVLGTISLRSPRDVIVAKFLASALEASKKGRSDDAARLLERARALAPEYYEVHRVAAVVHGYAGNTTNARRAYETALELAPDSAPLRFFFAGFLLRLESDAAGAVEQLHIAKSIDPTSPEIRTELARALLYTQHFDEAEQILGELEGERKGDERSMRIRYDLHLQCHTRRADVSSHAGEYVTAVEALERARRLYEAIPILCIDATTMDRLQRVVSTAEICAQRLISRGAAPSIVERAEAISDWLASELRRPIEAERELTVGELLIGTVVVLPAETFGFLQVDNGPRLFFHRSDLENPDDWLRLSIGSRVSFAVSPATGDHRFRAARVRLEHAVDPRFVTPGSRLVGRVVTLQRAKSFGFVRAVEGPRYFFHRSMVPLAADWQALEAGTPVEFVLGLNPLDNRLVANTISISRSVS